MPVEVEFKRIYEELGITDKELSNNKLGL